MSQILTSRAAEKFHALTAALATSYGVESVTKTFSVNPTMEQSLHDAITEEIEFLRMINVVGVRDKVGEKVYAGLTGSITKRTDTDNNDRTPIQNFDTSSKTYQLYKTESDVGIKYDLIDMWSKFPDFFDRFLSHVRKQVALDRIKIGLHGTSVATETDIGSNPMLQDVNKGWLQLVREQAAAQILTEGSTASQIRLGETGDFKTLDQLVADLKTGIHTRHRTGGDLVALIGEDLLNWDEGKLYASHGNTPTEKAGVREALKSYGGLKTMMVPFFPSKGLIVTSLDNLSIYYQEGSTRRKVEDNPKRDRIEDYNSRNEGYVVEENDKFVGVEPGNVTFV